MIKTSANRQGTKNAKGHAPPLFSFVLFVPLWLTLLPLAAAARVSVAVLDLGEGAAAARAADQLSSSLAADATLFLVNRTQARSAARGQGYAGSLNLTLEEARDLGAAVNCDLFITGEAKTLRRTSLSRGDYFESYASLFFVSARTGRLVHWEQPAAEAATAAEVENKMLAGLRKRAPRYAEMLVRAQKNERAEKLTAVGRDVPVVAEVPEEGTPEAKNFRAPLPYRRLRPAYTEAAARVGAEATVDALVELDAEGEVKHVEVARWAGYGLDEAVLATVRQLHFRPALRDGRPVPVRVLLRYNFRKPAKEAEKAKGEEGKRGKG